MLRLSFQKVVQTRVPFARNYSEGFDISKYLSRIESITKRPPIVHKARTKRSHPGTEALNAKKTNDSSVNARPKFQRPSSQQQNGFDNRRSKNEPGGIKFNRSSNARSDTKAPFRTNSHPDMNAQKPENKDKFSIRTQERTDAGWTTLDALDSQDTSKSPKALLRSNRRGPLRKNGLRIKFGKAGQTNKFAFSMRNKLQSHSLTRERIPYLTPQEGLQVIMRNEGTSYGGYIEPLDVSLPSLQPNFVESAVTYNSRVRSLLNAIPPQLAHDQATLKALVDKYVNGNYDQSIMSSAEKDLSYNSLASAVLANHSMSPTTRQFFAQVGAGKFTPKQLASR